MSSASADAPAATRVENVGLDVISESDRKGRPSDLFMTWFAANISVLGLSWGARVLGFGLSFWQAVVAAASVSSSPSSCAVPWPSWADEAAPHPGPAVGRPRGLRRSPGHGGRRLRPRLGECRRRLLLLPAP
ncbi:hypothetical protein BKH30_02565 [Actinomyces oris]|uniref:Cytosine permease n=1 Tax=Actinomyces oris TaxID=544580 RepID=A0A1Q8W2X2_9ACTO|nr:hypothetical protein BKH30_02565 [Actinomyces oris]